MTTLYTITERTDQYGDVIATVSMTSRNGRTVTLADFPSLADAASAVAEFKATDAALATIKF